MFRGFFGRFLITNTFPNMDFSVFKLVGVVTMEKYLQVFKQDLIWL